MAAADCTVFPVKGQAYRVYGFIKDSTTGNPIASIGTLSVTVSLDGTYSTTYSNGGGSALSATAVTSHAGRFYVDIPATPMDYYNIGLTIASNTSNAVSATIDITTVDLAESGTRAIDQTVKRFEQFWVQVWSRWFNRNTINRSTNAYSVYDDADSTVLYSGTAEDDGTTGTFGQLS